MLEQLLHPGAAYNWLYLPSAVLLGALHGLEPGHSKTMMAAFIVAIRGTVAQAMMLGLAATVSHTLVVWLVALLGMHLGSRWNAATVEPWLQLLAAVLVIGVAAWMIVTTMRHRHAHDHDHDHEDEADAHERQHAADIERRFRGRTISSRQILLFGLTGGLVPCPASITVLLVCLQLQQVALGAVLVLCFGIGLALTLVLSGVIAAFSLRHAQRHWQGFGRFAARTPYFSGALMLLVGLYMAWHGITGLVALPTTAAAG